MGARDYVDPESLNGLITVIFMCPNNVIKYKYIYYIYILVMISNNV